MADYRNDDDRTLPGVGMNRTPETDPEHLIADHTSAGAPGTIPAAGLSDDPDAVREEIERTRARMSRTIDELDRALVRKKEQVQEKLDVAAPIRQRPWMYAGGVFGTGLVLGLLTGGGKDRDDDDDGDHVKIPRALLAGMGLEQVKGGSGDWEGRARELMEVCARQEEEIRSLRGFDGSGGFVDDEAEGYLSASDARLLDDVEALGVADVEDEWDEEWNFADEDELNGEALGDIDAYAETGVNLRTPLAALLAAGVAGALGTVAKRVLGGRGDADELDVEVDLEPRGGAALDVEVDEAGRAARRQARHATGYTPHVQEYGPEYGEQGTARYEARPARGAYTADYTAEYAGEYRGEMDVEVELEQPVRRSLPPRRHKPRVSPLAGAVAAGAAAAVSGLIAKLLQVRAERASEMDVEVELESRPAPAPRRSPAPAPRPAARTQATGGEMEVEVELEGGSRATPSAWTPSPHLEQQPAQGISGSAFGAAESTGTTGELQVEVELEDRGTQGTTGGLGANPSNTGGSGTGGTGGPANPPLM